MIATYLQNQQRKSRAQTAQQVPHASRLKKPFIWKGRNTTRKNIQENERCTQNQSNKIERPPYFERSVRSGRIDRVPLACLLDHHSIRRIVNRPRLMTPVSEMNGNRTVRAVDL